ncbi:MAG: cytochrome c biogenesis protein CcsA [Pirellulales bacterium]|nr:cytochrome c biogenesis protein CcsA [Pirellulales bacterium]
MNPQEKNELPLATKPISGAALMLSVASAKIGVALIGILAVVLICATLLEAAKGMDFANWYVYKSTRFIVLLGLLSVNILAAVLVRIPRNLGGATALILSTAALFLAAQNGEILGSGVGAYYDRYWFITASACVAAALLAATLWNKLLGFFLAHGGVLVLLLGAYQTYSRGIDGNLSFAEGETAESIRLANQEKFTVMREGKPGGKPPPPAVFSFQPGPVDWPEGKTLEWPAELQGVKLKVLKYYLNSRTQESWVSAEEKQGEPAIRFGIEHAGGKMMLESWLAGEPLGGQGIPTLQLLNAPVDSMRAEFLNPPSKEEDEKGVLSVHYDGRTQRIPVSKNLGKKIALEGSKIEVEITDYYANAKPVGSGKFESRGDEPKNALLDLKIHLPDAKEPLRDLAFARMPMMSLAAMHGGDCPVKFWYHQPAASAADGVDFLRTPDGKLHCRTVLDGKCVSRGEVKEGSSIELAGTLRLKILEYLPFAVHKVEPQPLEAAAAEKKPPHPAAQVEVETDGVKQSVWLVRDDPKYSFHIFSTPKGKLGIQFAVEDHPLQFSLKLSKFTREMNPGRMGDAAYISTVQVIDEAPGIDREEEISMNRPLTYGKFTFYQSGCDELPDGRKVSTLSVSYDPGRFLKYLGSLMICVGMILRYLTNFRFYKRLAKWRGERGEGRGEREKTNLQSQISNFQSLNSVQKPLLALCLLLLGTSSAMAGTPAGANLDWKPWRYLPVQDGGRQKPFDTLALESVRMMTGGTSFSDPESGRKMDAVALYLAMLFDWQGWDQPAAAPHHADLDLFAAYDLEHKPDKWDRAPLLAVESKELRTALGIEGKKHVSPKELKDANYRDPETQKTTPFLEWAEKLSRTDRKNFSALEKKGQELAERYWAFMLHRMGRRLEILPVPNSPHQEWAPLSAILQTEYDDKTDPGGKLRKIKELFQKARSAYRADDAQAFQAASAAFLDAVESLGAEFGSSKSQPPKDESKAAESEVKLSYPTPEIIDLEVAYNHWTPFTIAWVLMSIAAICVAASKVANWTPFYVLSLAVYFAGIGAMFAGFTMRSMIGHRAPFTNMYESVLCVGVGIAVIGAIYELIYRKRYLLLAASILSALVLILADASPSICDPSIRPLMPVLRSNLLLTIHVLPIMASYAAFAVAWILANVSLTSHLLGPNAKDFTAALSKLMLTIIRFGVFLLTVGTILGGLWADLSWGRFWGWDPKEVWALITLLFYLNILHARYIGWMGNFGMAVWAVISFVAVITTWYGVNFVLGSGLHSYGSGSGGGAFYVIAGLAVQGLYLLAAAIVKYAGESAPEPAGGN